MAKEVLMPALGMAQETGILLHWLKSEGDAVQKGEPLMEVATDKTDVEIEAPASGILANVTAAEGDEIPVGQVIALITAPGEATPTASAGAEAKQESSAASAPTGAQSGNALPASPVAARIAAEHDVDLSQVQAAGNRIQKEDVLAYLAGKSQPQASPPAGRVLASPKARRLAVEYDLDLTALQGSGPEGAVLAADVLSAAEQASAKEPAVTPMPTPTPAKTAAESAETQTLPMSRMWKVMAERLTESWANVPHFFLAREVDASRLIAWREQANSGADTKITYTDLLVKLVATALDEHPRLNASWQEGQIVSNAQVNIGLAVAVDEGLLVPVIQQANQLGLQALAARRSQLVARAQTTELTLDDLNGGTFTISNLGMYGVDAFSAIVNPPQAGILAVGRIVERVVPVNGEPAVRPTLTLNLSCDHRVVDGARAARFLETLADFVEEPLRILA